MGEAEGSSLLQGFSLGSSAPLVNQGDLERSRRETRREREEEAFLLVSSSRMETHNGLHWANQGPFFLLHYVREFWAGSFPNLQLKHACGPATLGAHTGLHKAAIQSVHEAWRCVLLLFWLPLSWPDSISTWKARLPRQVGSVLSKSLRGEAIALFRAEKNVHSSHLLPRVTHWSGGKH